MPRTEGERSVPAGLGRARGDDGRPAVQDRQMVRHQCREKVHQRIGNEREDDSGGGDAENDRGEIEQADTGDLHMARDHIIRNREEMIKP